MSASPLGAAISHVAARLEAQLLLQRLKALSLRLRNADGGGGSASRQSPLAHSRAGWRWVESYLLPVLVTLLALSLYLYRLDSQSFWYDELANLYLSGWEGSWLDAISRPLSEPGTSKPPLSFLIAHLSLMLGEQAFLLRLPAALFATLTIPLVYALGRVLFAGQVRFPARCWTRSSLVRFSFTVLPANALWILLPSF